MIATSLSTGKGKFSFDQYVGRHKQVHNELLFLEEPVAETKKVTDFIAGICDPKLETAIQSCMGDELKLTNFEMCQQCYKTIVENTRCVRSRPLMFVRFPKLEFGRTRKEPSTERS